jgi:hypothetical protein
MSDSVFVSPSTTYVPQPGIAVPYVVESSLANDVVTLWNSHAATTTNAKRTREELKTLRDNLAEKLHQLKAIYARAGRNGQWSSWLEWKHIPRATADRLVIAYERKMNPPTESPEADPVDALLRSMLPRLKRVLTSSDAVDAFIGKLQAAFGPINAPATPIEEQDGARI